MAKKKYYCIRASKGNYDDISFQKSESGLVNIHMGYTEIGFTVKEAKEIADKLKKCANE